MKKILIIGAGFLQTFVIKKAREMGYHTITIDKNPNSIGFKYADEYSVVDIIDKNACLKYAASKNIDGVLTAATDYGVLSAAFVAKHLNLPGLDYSVSEIVKNKYAVRKRIYEKKVDDLEQFYKIGDSSELNKVKDNIQFPVMIKPCDGSGSKAINKVDGVSGLKGACEEAIKSSLIGKALIEDFIDGKEYGVESFVYNGEVHVLGVIGKRVTTPPVYAEVGHFFPVCITFEDKVKEVVKNAIKAIGINFGAVNMDIIITDDERVFIIDIGARMGGNLIGSHIIPYGTGIDYIEILIRTAVGDPVELKPKSPNMNVATRLLTLKPGKVLNLPDFQHIEKTYNVDIYHHLHAGSKIKEYRNNTDGCGYVVSISNNLHKSIKQVDNVKDLIDFKIVRK